MLNTSHTHAHTHNTISIENHQVPCLFVAKSKIEPSFFFSKKIEYSMPIKIIWISSGVFSNFPLNCPFNPILAMGSIQSINISHNSCLILIRLDVFFQNLSREMIRFFFHNIIIYNLSNYPFLTPWCKDLQKFINYKQTHSIQISLLQDNCCLQNKFMIISKCMFPSVWLQLMFCNLYYGI